MDRLSKRGAAIFDHRMWSVARLNPSFTLVNAMNPNKPREPAP
jgi:hypothetical protein